MPGKLTVDGYIDGSIGPTRSSGPWRKASISPCRYGIAKTASLRPGDPSPVAPISEGCLHVGLT